MKIKALTAAVALVLSGAANAAIDDPLANGEFNAGGSELVLTIWDTVNFVSTSVDIVNDSTTMGWNDFDPVGSYTFEIADTGGIDLSAEGVVWGVLAVDSNFQGTDVIGAEDWGLRLMSTTTENFGIDINETVTFQSAGNAEVFIDTLNAFGTNPTEADGITVESSGFGYWGGGMDASWLQGSGATTTAAVGDEMYFLMAEEIVEVTQLFPGLNQKQVIGINQYFTDGTWLLSADGSLSYTAIPLPPAVWLLGSALVGLVGVARRRRSVAAA